MNRQWITVLGRTSAALVASAVLCVGTTSSVRSGPPAVPISIATIPLTIPMPAHPQILFAMGNSESMDGNLSGAIMTGSGSLGAAFAGLNASSSPVNYTIPVGFTPPLNPGGGGVAPYTVPNAGLLYDNSPSRLNVAKAGIAAVLNTYMAMVDFALMDYQNGGATYYNTMVYEMSPTASDFTFTNAVAIPPAEQVLNPCYQIPQDGANPVDWSCWNLAGTYGGANLFSNQYMNVSASSDDPNVNDILYGGGGTICTAVGPPTLFNYNLWGYENGWVLSAYGAGCNTWTGPTNAGFVPGSQDVMYISRGFGYGSGQSPNSAAQLVGMTSAGAVPNSTSVANAIAQFTPYLAPETNSTGTGEIKAQTFQSPTGGLMRQAKHFWQATPPTSNGCPATPYTVLVTDGLPTLDLAGHNWPPLGAKPASDFGVSATFDEPAPPGTGALVATNDQALTDALSEINSLLSIPTPGLPTNGVKTYVIGLGAGVDPTKNQAAAYTLTALAVAGGTNAYFPATSPATLTADMQAILAQVLATTQSTASTSVNSTGLHNGSIAYLAQFTTSDTFQDWTGNLSAYQINAATGQVNTGPGMAIWSAQTQLDAQNWDTGRFIATWDPVANAGTPFRWNPALAPAGISATVVPPAAPTGTTLGIELSTFPPDTNGQDVLQFVRGSNAKEIRNGGQFRNRTHKLGDIVDSSPLYVGAPYSYEQSASYLAFANTYKNRSAIIYVGANDGMLHAFDALTGDERFAYIPNGVWSNLIALVNPYFNEQHLFYVNGSPVAADVQFSDSSWHTMLVGTEGAGGSTVFALDVTDPDSVVNETTLAAIAKWEFSDTDMGLSYSEPQIANTAAGWLVFFGNGYNSPNEKPVLYAVNPQTGAIVQKIDLCAQVAGACNMSLANGLSSVEVINSNGEPQLGFDTLYAGDLQGNMWRVDISNPNPASWLVSVIFQARDSGGNIQPITTAPTVTLNPDYPRLPGTMVFFGTGQLLGLPDLATTQTQTLYGIFDPPTGSAAPLGFVGTPTRANLVQQTLTNATVGGVSVRVETSVNPVTLPTNRGWYVDFNLVAGERVVTNPEVETGGGVVLTTYQPNSNSCQGGGNAYLNVFNFATGGSFPLPELDINGDNQLNASDQAAGKNPVSMYLGNVFASAATILPTSGNTGNITARKLVSTSNVKVQSTGDRGGTRQRSGWWELRH
jgi:type IV pilus assembly protein PilY1